MSEEPSSSQEKPVWINVSDMERRLVEHVLPIERDEGGRVEGYPGTYFKHELNRIHGTWRGTNSWQDRKLGVGNKVLIKAGTPIQTWSPIGVRGANYVATEDITGTLKEETEKHLLNVSGSVSIAKSRYEWIETTKSIFKVSVDLPTTTDPEIAKRLEGRIDVDVPNDMLELAGESSTPSSESTT